jgi:hypothetical protein
MTPAEAGRAEMRRLMEERRRTRGQVFTREQVEQIRCLTRDRAA